MNLELILHQVVSSVVFSLVGLAVFALGFVLLRVVVPFDIRKEIEVDQNTSLGLVIAALILGLAFIVGMAVHGG